jgi:hypothetical protein
MPIKPALLGAAVPIALTTPVAAQSLPGTTCALFPADNILNADRAAGERAELNVEIQHGPEHKPASRPVSPTRASVLLM